MSLCEWKTAGRIFIVSMDHHLFAGRAAIGLCDVEMDQVLSRTDPVLFGRLVVDMFDARDVAEEQYGGVPVDGTDWCGSGAATCQGWVCGKKTENSRYDDFLHR